MLDVNEPALLYAGGHTQSISRAAVGALPSLAAVEGRGTRGSRRSGISGAANRGPCGVVGGVDEGEGRAGREVLHGGFLGRTGNSTGDIDQQNGVYGRTMDVEDFAGNRRRPREAEPQTGDGEQIWKASWSFCRANRRS